MPHIENFKLGFTDTKCPSNPLGMKGCGEAGAIAAPPAVMNAITDALGVRDIAMPATPLSRVECHAAHETRRRIGQGTENGKLQLSPPRNASDAAAALLKKAKDGKFMAGGMTLLPTMKQGLASPTDIIDLSGHQGHFRSHGRRNQPW